MRASGPCVAVSSTSASVRFPDRSVLDFFDRNGLAWLVPVLTSDCDAWTLEDVAGLRGVEVAAACRLAAAPEAFLDKIGRCSALPKSSESHSAATSTVSVRVPFALEVFGFRLASAALQELESQPQYQVSFRRLVSRYASNDVLRASPKNDESVSNCADFGMDTLDWDADMNDEVDERAMMQRGVCEQMHKNRWTRLRLLREEPICKVLLQLEGAGYVLWPQFRFGEFPQVRQDDDVQLPTPPRITNGGGTMVACPECQRRFTISLPSRCGDTPPAQNPMPPVEREWEHMAELKFMRLRVADANQRAATLEASLKSLQVAHDAQTKALHEQTCFVESLREENRRLRSTVHHSYHSLGDNVRTGRSPPQGEAQAPAGRSVAYRAVPNVSEPLVDGGTRGTAPRHPWAAVDVEDRRRIRQALVSHLQRLEPERLWSVDRIMHAWKEREYQLERVLHLHESRSHPAADTLLDV